MKYYVHCYRCNTNICAPIILDLLPSLKKLIKLLIKVIRHDLRNRKIKNSVSRVKDPISFFQTELDLNTPSLIRSLSGIKNVVYKGRFLQFSTKFFGTNP